MAKKNDALTFDIAVRAPGVVTVKDATIDSVTATAVTVNRRRDGSSKRQIEFIPRKSIIFVKGSLTKGENADITYMSSNAPALRKLTRCTMDGYDEKSGLYKGQNDKGEPILVNAEFAAITTNKEAEVEAPASATPSKKKASGDKKKKKAE